MRCIFWSGWSWLRGLLRPNELKHRMRGGRLQRIGQDVAHVQHLQARAGNASGQRLAVRQRQAGVVRAVQHQSRHARASCWAM